MDTRLNITDDPRLTAYALGELKGQEREAIERLVRASAEARAEVEAIRQVAGALTYELAGDLPRSPVERAACSERICNAHALEPAGIPHFVRAAASPRDRSSVRRRLGLATAGATAAGIAIMLMVLSSNPKGLRTPEHAASGSAQGERQSVAQAVSESAAGPRSDQGQPLATSSSWDAHNLTLNAASNGFAGAAPAAEAAVPPTTNMRLGGSIPDAYRHASPSPQSHTANVETGAPYNSDPFQPTATVGGLTVPALPSAELPPSSPAPSPVTASTAGNQPLVGYGSAPSNPILPGAAAAIPASVDASGGPAYALPSAPMVQGAGAAFVPATAGQAASASTVHNPNGRGGFVGSTGYTGYAGPIPSAANAGSSKSPRNIPYTICKPPYQATGSAGSSVTRSGAVATNAGVPRGGQAAHTVGGGIPDDSEFDFEIGPRRHHGTHDTHVGSESYAPIVENAFLAPLKEPLSTFSVDVDTASYANVRRFLEQQQLPPPDAVRIEEMLNYFSYDYAPPADGKPFAVHVETAACPWNTKHRLARIAIKGREVPRDKRPPSNLVFLVDVSGSMDEPNKLPLVKASLAMLVESLTENDRIAIVTYAGSVQKVLDSTTGERRSQIMAAINQLTPGGSTNGEGGIQMAYETAVKNFRQGGTNRIILCTDGDFNVGVSDDGELVKLIEEKRKSGVFLSIFGFGMGNLKDARLEKLADHGNGQYGYIDSRQEARKVFVEGLSGTLVTIAKDVKLQIEFNPAQVGAYRLIGYENRALAAQDFNNDAKDAGDIGAGHSVTALYEIVPASELKVSVDPLKYQGHPAKAPADKAASDELFTLKLRYKQPDGQASQKIEIGCKDRRDASAHPSRDFDWAAGVAAFGLLLRDSKYKGNATFDLALELAQGGKGADKHGYRGECIELMRKAKGLKTAPKPVEPVPGPLGEQPAPIGPFGQPVPVQTAPSAPYAPGSTQSGSMP